MPKDQDVRLKLTAESHSMLVALARLKRMTIQDYVERLLTNHCNRQLEIARMLVRQTDRNLDIPITRQQYVYFVRRGSDGPVKIGVTAYPKRRVADLQCGAAEPLELLGEFETSPDLSEAGLHRRFAHLRLEGEWFKPDREIFEFIAGLKRDAA